MPTTPTSACRLARVLLLLACLTVPRGLAQIPAELVEEALDQPVTQLDIEPAPIREALAKLGEATGLRFRVEDDAIARMPYGERTKIAVTVREMSVRRAVQGVLAGLGLEMTLDGDVLVVHPAPVLDRLGRRLTLDEAKLLERLGSATWEDVNRQQAVALEFRVDPAQRPLDAFAKALQQSQGVSALRQLDAAVDALGWAWLLEGERVVLMPRREEIARRIDSTVDLDYRRVPLDELLTDLCGRVGVTVLFEPGVLARVSAGGRRVDLVQKSVTVRQTLERICGATGLRYAIESEGVRILSPEGQSQEPAPRTARDPDAEIIAMLRIPLGPNGIALEFPLRTQDLPEELRSKCERKREEALQQIRDALSQNP